MAFDKEQYRKNRNLGMRGQGEDPLRKTAKVVAPDTEVKHVGRVGKEVVPINRAASRRKMVARIYSGEHDTEGMKHTQKRAPHNNKRTLFQRMGIHHPTQDPKLSSNKRVIGQRIRSGRWDITKLPAQSHQARARG